MREHWPGTSLEAAMFSYDAFVTNTILPLIAQHTLMKYASRNSKIRTTLSLSFTLFLSFWKSQYNRGRALSRHFIIRIKVAEDEGREDGILRGWEMGWRPGPSRGSFARLNNGNPGIFSYDRRSDEWWSHDEFYGERSRVPLKTAKWIFWHRWHFNRHF